jgi:double zinc ribbon protein
MILALVLGTLFALAALAFVLAPVVVGVRRRPLIVKARPGTSASDLSIAALREIEFDRATGKLSDTDYAVLREQYAGAAIAAMRASAAGAAPAPVDDAVEAAVRAYRDAHPTCGTCGIRPEPDAIYCSTCGEFLPGKCASCGARVTAKGVRFCIDCGTRLAA